LSASLFWAFSLPTYNDRPWWRTFRKRGLAAGLIFCGAIAAGAYWQFQSRNPTIDDLSISFVPEQFDAERLVGRVVVRSKAQRPLTIDEIRFVAPGAVGSGGKPTDVQQGHDAAFPTETYFWHGGIVTFEGHYSVNGKPRPDAIYAEFDVPPVPRLGDEIPPHKCCNGPKSDFIALRQHDGELVADGPEGCLPVTAPEHRLDGGWYRVRDAHQRRVFIFDPLGRQAVMESDMQGKWYWIRVRLDQTIDGMHQVRYCWKESTGYMAIDADGYYAMMDAYTGKGRQGSLNEASQ
jgi:hypothetical protein